MEDFINIMRSAYNFFQIPFEIYGFELTFWDIFMFVLVIGIILGFLGGLFSK